jgi:Mycothiol maleylpyruvate isomerase N-terminal domain
MSPSFDATAWPGHEVRATIRGSFVAASVAAAELLHDPAVAAAWQAPSALSRYTVAGLAGHLAGQVFFIPRALEGPAPGPDTAPIPILEYYQRVEWMRAGHDDSEHVRIRRGSEATAAVGPKELAAQVDATVARLGATLAAEPPGRLVRLPTWSWSLTLDDFALSRTMELAVHIDDLAVSAEVPAPELPPEVVDLVVDLLTRLATRQHGPAAVLRALTRAERAPATITAL